MEYFFWFLLEYIENCVDNCSGRGECNLGFCDCHDGWHGVACNVRKWNQQVKEISKGFSMIKSYFVIYIKKIVQDALVIVPEKMVFVRTMESACVIWTIMEMIVLLKVSDLRRIKEKK